MKHLERKPIPDAPPAPPGSLAAALAAVPDPRRPYGWRPERSPLPLTGVLQVAVAAMLCGARSLSAVAQWGRERVEDAPTALVPLGVPPGRSPSVATLHRLFKALDVAAFEQALGTWLAQTGVDPDDAVALDGKTCAVSTATNCQASTWSPPTPTSPGRCSAKRRARARGTNWRRSPRCWTRSRWPGGW